MALSQEEDRPKQFEALKLSRSTVKGRITAARNKLEKILNEYKDQDFDHEQINRIEIQETHEKLKSCFSEFKEVHLKCLEMRDKSSTEQEDESILQAQEAYLEEVASKVYPVLAAADKYEKSYQEYVKQKQLNDTLASQEEQKVKTKQDLVDMLPALKRTYNKTKCAYEAQLEAANDIVAWSSSSPWEELSGSAALQDMPAASVKDLLKKAFDAVEQAANEVASAFEAGGKTEDDIAKEVSFSYEKEIKAVTKTSAVLEKIVNAQDRASLGTHSSTPLGSSTMRESMPTPTPLKLAKPDPIKFSGNPRDFASFKENFESIVVPNRSAADVGLYLKQAVPEKHKHLIKNIRPVDYEEMMTVLSEKFGTTRLLVESINTELDRMKVPSTDKMFVDFVEKIEKIRKDLDAVGKFDEIANAQTISKLESKLPQMVMQDWLKEIIKNKYEKGATKVKLEGLLRFLAEYKEMAEYGSAFESAGVRAHTCFVTGQTVEKKLNKEKKKYGSEDQTFKGTLRPCLACNDGATNEDSILHNVGDCEVWRSLSIQDKRGKVQCIKHPFSDHKTANCNTAVRACKYCNDKSHHFLLCPTKKASSHACSTKSMLGNGGIELPVMVQTSYTHTGLGGVRLGTMWDLCSTDHYILNKTAKKLALNGTDVELLMEGIKGQEHYETTKLYDVPIVDKQGTKYIIQCYGLDKISSRPVPPKKTSYSKLCDRFKVSMKEVEKPNEIQLLVSMRKNSIHPVPVKRMGEITLYEGPFGKVFGGCDEQLDFEPPVKSCPVRVVEVCRAQAQTLRTAVTSATRVSSAKTEKEFLDYFKEESIGVSCVPSCGGCKCGQCPTGAKSMSLKDERAYERFKNNLTYQEHGTKEDPGPYWKTSYPWIVDKENLENNLPAVMGVMKATKRKLAKDPSWEAVYETQLKDLISRGVAREVPEDELESWKASGGKAYYIAHQVALNPGSKTTPVRVVFNSSQVYKGYSLNSCLELGPDIMSNLHGVLVRFRNDIVGGSGDVAKMFYMVRVNKEEEMCQLFVWQFRGEKKLKTYAMTRLVMGNIPSTNISLVAVKETANFVDFKTTQPVAHEALNKNSYVDNVYLTAANHEELEKGIKEIEFVAAKGGFKFKEWVRSGQDVPEQVVSVKLPDAIDEEKVLGLYWDVQKDQFYVKFAMREADKKFLEEGGLAVDDETSLADASSIPIVKSVALKLTLRIALSLHAKTHDPIGLVLPTRMIGALLFRESLQLIKKGVKGKIPWDQTLPEDLIVQWVVYFEMLVKLEDIKFNRSIKPSNADPKCDPGLITFEDGSKDAFGANAYALWQLLDGKKACNLIMSKAKLAPLLQLGEPFRNELCGAVHAARLTEWICEHSDIKFGYRVHFLDSQIVQAMTARDSYGFNTFAALRIGEIQQKTDIHCWLHIPSKENISDVLTRGAPPSMLGEDSIWQHGPEWLLKDRSMWPVTPRNDKSLNISSEDMKTFCKKKAATNVASIKANVDIETARIMKMIENFSSLNKLIRSMARYLRFRLLKRPLDAGGSTLEGRPPTQVEAGDMKEVSSSEYFDAWNVLVYFVQQNNLKKENVQRLVPVEIKIQLLNYAVSIPVIVIGGRVKSFPVGFSYNTNIPIIPHGHLGKLVVRHYHNKFHKDVDSIVAQVRSDVWVISARKIASSIDGKCRICLVRRHKVAGQLMGELPECRSDPVHPAWTSVNMDIFGPYIIRDDCVKKGPRVFKKVWGVIYTCTLTRGVYLDVIVDYSTQAVLHTIRKLLANKGNVRLIISDCGSQLRGADAEMKSWRYGWDKNELIKFGSSEGRGLEWKFIMPASQHQNGAAEVLIKLVKGVYKSFLKSLGDKKLSLNELNTLMAEISNIVNQRPIGVKPNTRCDPEYLSPNSLYLGRASDRINQGPFQPKHLYTDKPSDLQERFILVQNLTTQFWKNWIKIYFPTLLIRQKWHWQKRNVQEGDICFLKEEDAVRADWRLARVVNTFPDRRGCVRNVELAVVPRQGGATNYEPVKPNYLKRHVSNVVILVAADQDASEQ